MLEATASGVYTNQQVFLWGTGWRLSMTLQVTVHRTLFIPGKNKTKWDQQTRRKTQKQWQTINTVTYSGARTLEGGARGEAVRLRREQEPQELWSGEKTNIWKPVRLVLGLTDSRLSNPTSQQTKQAALFYAAVVPQSVEQKLCTWKWSPS